MREMETIATDDPVAWCVCLSVRRAPEPCKIAEQTDVLFGVETPADPRNIVLDEGPHLPRLGGGGSMRPFPNYFGHLLTFTVKVNIVNESIGIRAGGLPSTYTLKQFHFHWGSIESVGSEHRIDGHAYPIEVRART